jgi:hypothetical protein
MNRKPLAVLIIASSLAAFGTLAQAQSSPTNRSDARSDTRSAAGVEFTSGGVGLAARQQLASQSGQYNLHLEFAYAPEGEYMSEVQVDINDARGNNVLSTRTDGPWLFARLPAGNYTVKASFDNVTRSQQVNVGGGKRHLVMRFPAQVETTANRSSSGSSAPLASR